MSTCRIAWSELTIAEMKIPEFEFKITGNGIFRGMGHPSNLPPLLIVVIVLIVLVAVNVVVVVIGVVVLIVVIVLVVFVVNVVVVAVALSGVLCISSLMPSSPKVR